MFLHAVGPEGRKVNNTITFKGKPTLEGIVLNFEKLAIGMLNETNERYIFNQKNQEPGKSVAQYVRLH